MALYSGRSLPAFGIALVEREIARVERFARKSTPYSLPLGSAKDQIAMLNKAKEVISHMDAQTLPGRFSWPTLWHTDLHLGNIYVSDDDPTQIVSLIDWQSISISPLFYQVRFPEFLDVSDEYEVGTDVPTLPEDIEEMDPDDQELIIYEHKQVCMAKAYEAASGFKNKNVYKALQLPSFFKELFVRCGEVWEVGAIPFRACLIEIYETWEEAGFSGKCPLSFTKDDIERHEREFKEYSEDHKIREIARKYLRTDFEGWIAPDEDFETKQHQNRELLQLVIANSVEYSRSVEEIKRIWPFYTHFGVPF